MSRRPIVTALLIAATCATAGCSALGSVNSSPTSTPPAAATETTTTPAETMTTPATPTTSAIPLNPNTASEEQIATALDKAGVPNSAELAKQVKANAPYTSDNIVEKLQSLVTSAQVSPGDIDKIRQALGY